MIKVKKPESILDFINDVGADSIPSSSNWLKSGQDLSLSTLNLECDSSGELVDTRSVNRNEQPHPTNNNRESTRGSRSDGNGSCKFEIFSKEHV